VIFGTGSTSFDAVKSSSSIGANEWHHVVGTYDGETRRVYVDGVMEGSVYSPGQLSPNTADLVIGGYDEPFDGVLDEVRIFNRALNSDEIKRSYLTVAPFHSGVAGVELYYRHSLDNSTWGEWTSYGTDSAAPYSWSFTAPDGYALYEFYSVATDVAGNVEEPPEQADASCGVAIPAAIDIDPDTLNLKSKGKWVTAYIQLPPGYGVEHVGEEPYDFEMDVEGDLTVRQWELLNALIQEIKRTLASVEVEIDAEGGKVEVETEGYLSEENVARLAPGASPWPKPSARTLLSELVQELKREGNEVEIEIEKEVDWGNYRTTIDVTSVKLENVPAVSDPKYGFVREPELEDRDGDGLPELMVKFDRSQVQDLLQPGEAELTVTGKWRAVLFMGSETIRVI
jgi:hypothetical protein